MVSICHLYVLMGIAHFWPLFANLAKVSDHVPSPQFDFPNPSM
jgi:hypothetical protein